MSFQKKRTTISLPGTRKSLQYGQQLISTGNPALDHILGNTYLNLFLKLANNRFYK